MTSVSNFARLIALHYIVPAVSRFCNI